MYGRFLSRFWTRPWAERWTSQTVAIARPTRMRKSPRLTEWVARYSLGDAVLALTTSAVDDWDPVRSGKAMHSATEATSHPHQVRVIEVLFGAIVQTPPPLPEAASRVSHRVERIENDAIDAV